MYLRISVPLDGTIESQTALRWAVAIAQRARCPVDLVHVASPPILGSELYGAVLPQRDDVDRMRGEAMQQLRQLADAMGTQGVRASPTVLMGQLPQTLTEHLAVTGTDLIVMTTHDPARLEHLVLGSSTESVMRDAQIPVLVVRHDDRTPSVAPAAKLSHILIPLDGSAFAAQIIPHAEDLATVMDADLTLVRVVQPALATAAMNPGIQSGFALPPASPDDDRAHMEGEALALERIAESMRAKDIDVRTSVVIDSRPAHAIVDFAKGNRMDVIAMTTHGRRGLGRVVAGSVAHSILRNSAVPMLLYRPRLE